MNNWCPWGSHNKYSNFCGPAMSQQEAQAQTATFCTPVLPDGLIPFQSLIYNCIQTIIPLYFNCSLKGIQSALQCLQSSLVKLGQPCSGSCCPASLLSTQHLILNGPQHVGWCIGLSLSNLHVPRHFMHLHAQIRIIPVKWCLSLVFKSLLVLCPDLWGSVMFWVTFLPHVMKI